jgi:hypothetical protein
MHEISYPQPLPQNTHTSHYQPQITNKRETQVTRSNINITSSFIGVNLCTANANAIYLSTTTNVVLPQGKRNATQHHASLCPE